MTTSGEESDNESEELSQNPWPYLNSVFEFARANKNVDKDKRKTFIFKCLLCLPKQNFLSAFNNLTSHLKKHVDRCHESHKWKYAELTKVSLKRKSKSLPGTSSTNLKQVRLEETKQLSQKTVDNAVLSFIVQGQQPFSLVEVPAFRSLVTDLQPKYTVMFQTTVQHKLGGRWKEKIKEEMKKASYIATTTDCWSARRRSFLGITAHCLDPSSFKRHSVVLACRQLKGSHTFGVLAGALNDIHLEYEIREKIVRTTTDDGSNFIKVFRVFGVGEDENNNAAAETTDAEETTNEDDETDEETEEEEEEEVEFIDVEAILAEDDGLQYELPKHHRCACHLLNLVSSVDVKEADKTAHYKTLKVHFWQIPGPVEQDIKVHKCCRGCGKALQTSAGATQCYKMELLLHGCGVDS
ncbi:uncharacterized protein LOC125007117 [Mugil cephalus]|uniref:uncharacterized protein LOC125007117 n=1 Tax=Mugil cephalus TaxID=48193 RepID=UPI001FB859D5|nr:uncharacterized protein LOC125007117 [Mugil cephalus]